jgi:type IV pilus assembly protein PilC
VPTFAWEGKGRTGETRRGTIEADSEALVMARLRADQINVTRVKKQGQGLSVLSFGTGVSEKDLVVFTRQFATMIDAGLPLV